MQFLWKRLDIAYELLRARRLRGLEIGQKGGYLNNRGYLVDASTWSFEGLVMTTWGLGEGWFYFQIHTVGITTVIRLNHKHIL